MPLMIPKNLLTVLFLFCAIGIKAQNDASKLSADAVTSDLDYLYTSLQDTHYNLYAFKTKKAFDSIFTLLKKSVRDDSLTTVQTVSLYQQLVSFANTGHCEIDFPAQPYIEYAYAGGTVFPLELAIENDNVFVRKCFIQDDDISIGDEILRIDGKPIYEILKMMYPFVSAEREYFKKAKIEFWSFPRLYYQAFGTKETWQIQLKKQNHTIVNLAIKAIPVIAYESSRGGELVNPQKSFRYYGKTAYLNPGAFSSPHSNGEEIFKKYIDSVFTDVKTTNTENLIIDLRNHPGGHNAYSDYLISYFANKPFRWYSEFSLKTSEILKKNQTSTRFK